MNVIIIEIGHYRIQNKPQFIHVGYTSFFDTYKLFYTNDVYDYVVPVLFAPVGTWHVKYKEFKIRNKHK